MAELNQTTDPGKGKIRAKKMSTRIDMTPMVDLAFLLLTFFILTTTFSKNYVLEMDRPENTTERTLVNDENILNLALERNNKLSWWTVLDGPVAVTNYSRNGVRKILFRLKSENPNLIVLIKPADDSKFENMIDILDELRITGMDRYAIVDLTEDDARFLASSR